MPEEEKLKPSEKQVDLDTSGPEVDVVLEESKEEVVDTAPETKEQEVVEEVKVETEKNLSRAAVTRTKTERPKEYKPPSSLDAPTAPDGFRHRWIRAESMGCLLYTSPSPRDGLLARMPSSA